MLGGEYMKNNNSNTGLGFSTTLTLIFVVLKLCKVINWSWIWVLSPLWIGTILVILIYLGIYLYYKKQF